MAYTKKTWTKGEIIKATDLNNIEDGIEAVTSEVGAIEEHFDPTKGMLFVRANTIQPTIGDGILGCFVCTSSASHNGYSYKTEIEQGGGKIVCGIAKTNKAHSYQLVFGQVNILSNNFVSVFPWVSDYIDENYVIQATAEGKTTVLVGSNVSTGTTDFTMGSTNVTTGSVCMNFGQYNHVTQHIASTIGEGLLAGYRTQFCVGCANENKEEDAFEIGNGTYDISAGTISRSNAFCVTKTGSAIAQTSLGIEDGNGGVVSITAEQLQALLALIPPQYEVKELTSSNKTYSMAAFDDISKLPTPTPYQLQSGGYYLNTVSTTIAGLRMDGGVSPSINGAILKVDGGSTVNFNPGALDISYAMCEFNANMNQPIGGASPNTWLTESTTLKDTTAYIGIHFKVNSGEMTDQIRSQLLSTISIVSE